MLQEFVIHVFFAILQILDLGLKNLFLGLFAKAYSSYNIHVMHFAFGQCIVYIVVIKEPTIFSN